MKKIPTINDQFVDIAERVTTAYEDAMQSANTVLLDLYWQIGESISRKMTSAEWTENTVEALAQHLACIQPGLRGFTHANLLRMRQFYEIYKNHAKVHVWVKLLPWTHNRIILNQSKNTEEREFYLRMALQENWTERELEKQIKSNLFERVFLWPKKVVPMLLHNPAGLGAPPSDDYLLEFLGVSSLQAETDPHCALTDKIKCFFIDLDSDFCFMGSKFPLQSETDDVPLDFLFFHRDLNALLAIKFKLGEFESGDLEQLSMHLDVLDCTIKKDHEQPSIGLLLCASSERNTVKYRFNTRLSPELIAGYERRLPSKMVLKIKLGEFHVGNKADNAIA